MHARLGLQEVQSYVATIGTLNKLNLHRGTSNKTPVGGYLIQDLSEQHVPVVIDSGCTRSVTPFRNDFDSAIDTSNEQEMVGLKDSVSIQGEGYVNWTIRDAFGHSCAIRTRACCDLQFSLTSL